MCGIAGYVTFDPQQPAEPHRVRAMTRTLIHRGPDDEGYYVDGPVALGMRRLRVIDLEGGRQPICNEDGTIWVVFNGEIYNYRELRQQLASRHRFTTESDTEVIVHLYEERGSRCVEALRGMFAFALWDARRRCLLIARDHLGEKPLYYAETPTALCFGSEIKAVRASGLVASDLDVTAFDDYCALGYVPAPRTIFRSVKKLPAAHLLEVNGPTTTRSRFWHVRWNPVGMVDRREADERIEAALTRSVAQRMIADVPLGAFLSGGIDSTAVVRLMSRMASSPVRTFSIGFDHADYNELPYAREVARAFRTEHHEQVVKPDALRLLPTLVEHFDEPFADASAVPTYLVAQLARQHVTVALSGDGGDEVFAGYSRYRKAFLMDRVRPYLLGSRGLRLAAAVAGGLPLPAAWRYRAVSALRRAAQPAVQRYLSMVALYDDDVREEVFATRVGSRRQATPDTFLAAWQDAGSFDPIRRFQAVDTETYLPDDILVKVDRASMAVSLESRAPFLDPDLVQYVATLPTALKYRGGLGKMLLRRSLDGHVPPAVLKRPKQGFAIPLREWFRQGWQHLARELLFDGGAASYFRREGVQKLLTEHAGGVADHGERLWVLLVFAAWHRRHVEDAA